MYSQASRAKNQPAVIRAEAMDKWKNIIPVNIAKAVFHCVKGNADKLCVQPGASSSVWGKVVKFMGLENTKINRLWAAAAYHSKSDIRVIHQQLSKQNKSRFVNIVEPTSETRYCICQNAEASSGNAYYSMLECSTCLDWYHADCVGERIELYQDDPYLCPRCQGLPEEEIAPPIFLPLPQKNLPKKISLGASANEDSLDTTGINLRSANIQSSPTFHNRSPVTAFASPRQILNTSTETGKEKQFPFPAEVALTKSKIQTPDLSKKFRFKKPTSSSHSGQLGQVKPLTRTTLSPNEIEDDDFRQERQPKFSSASAPSALFGKEPGQKDLVGLQQRLHYGRDSLRTEKSDFGANDDIVQGRSSNVHLSGFRRSIERHEPPEFEDDEEEENETTRYRTINTKNLGGSRFVSPEHGSRITPTRRFGGDDVSNVKRHLDLGFRDSDRLRRTMQPAGKVTKDVPESSRDLGALFEKSISRVPVRKSRQQRESSGSDDSAEHSIPDEEPVNCDNILRDTAFVDPGAVEVASTVDATGEQPEVIESIAGIEGPVTGFKPFFITIPKAEYQRIANRIPNPGVRDKRYSWKFDSKIWPHIFHKEFLHQCPSQMKGCNVNFKDHRFPIERGGNIFCEMMGYCNRSGSVSCTMKYKLHIIDEPIAGRDVRARVTPTGTLHHDLSKVTKRKLAGVRREEAKLELKNMSAGILRRTLYGKDDTEKEALKKSNLSEVQTLNVFRKARQEVMSEGDLDKDPYRDLEKRAIHFDTQPHLQGRHLNGFIQELARRKFHVSFYCERQLDLLRKYLKYDPAGVIHLDSTGNVTGKLPPELGGTASFYYAAVIQLPGSVESPCVPVMEFITNLNSASKISHLLHYFFRLYGEKFGSKEYGFGIKRIETDCSRTLISAVLQALEIGRTERYLRDTWYHLTRNKPIYFVHHICRTHAVNFTNKHIDENFNAENQKLIRTWRDKLLFGKCLEDFCRRVRDIGYLCGKKYMTNDVKEVVSNLQEPTVIHGEKPWSSTHLDDLPTTGALYGTSPFGNFALKIFYDMKVPLNQTLFDVIGVSLDEDEENDDAVNSLFEENPTFSIKFLEYLIKWVFCLGPMFDHSLMTLNSYKTNVDTNAASEAWNKLLKKDEMVFGLQMKIGRFAAFEEEVLRGRLEMFENGLLRKQREKGGALVRRTVPQTLIREDNLSEDPESSQEQWRRKQQRPPTISILPSFVSHLVLNIDIQITTGTCTTNLNSLINFQNPLQILYCLYKSNQNFADYMNKSSVMLNSNIPKNLTNTFSEIDSRNFNRSIATCLKEIMQQDIAYLNSDDIFLGEIQFIRAIGTVFPVVEISDCKEECAMSTPRVIYPMRDVVISSRSPISQILSPAVQNCEFCLKKDAIIRYKWASSGALPMIAFAVDFRSVELQEADLPNSIMICGTRFDLYAYTSESQKIFYSVFLFKKKKYFYQPGNDTKVIKKLTRRLCNKFSFFHTK